MKCHSLRQNKTRDLIKWKTNHIKNGRNLTIYSIGTSGIWLDT